MAAVVSLVASAARGSFMLSDQKPFIQMVQNILLFGYSLGCSVSSAANLVKNIWNNAIGLPPPSALVQLCTQCRLSARMLWASTVTQHVERNPLGA